MEPESEAVVENIASLPIIKNSVVWPYQNSEKPNALFVKSLPQTLCKIIYHGKDKLPCLICKKLIVLHQMHNHVGFHILRKLRNTSDQVFQPVGEIPCGFCGLDGCITQLATSFSKKKHGQTTIVSTCLYHHSKMNYKAASVFSQKSPCTNIPIQCSICPPTSSGSPQTIWKYNAVNHFIIKHSNSDHSPSIPGDFLVQIVIRMAEEKAMGIQERDTVDYRERVAIPDSDGLEPEQRTAVYKRSRSDTTSTIHSQDSHWIDRVWQKD